MKNKKNIIFILVIAFVAIIGTSAYFLYRNDVSNLFKTSPYSITVSESFQSPDDWMPGDTTPINFYVKNNTDLEVATRVSCDETWTDDSDNTYENEIDGVKGAIINLSNNSNWIKEGNYYYYYKKIGKNEQTSSFADSVTYNPEVNSDYYCRNYSLASDNCRAVPYPYLGATFNLECNFETVQYNEYKNAWNTNIEIE